MESLSEKRCYLCHQIKPASAFNKRQLSRDGLQGYCRACAPVAQRRVPVMETRPCDYCGTLLTRRARDFSRRQHWYCGPSCHAKQQPTPMILAVQGQSVRQPCTECGVPLKRPLSQAKLSEHPCCGHVCKARWYGRKRLAAGTWNPPTKPRRGDEQPCGFCGKPVYKEPGYPSHQTRYCGRQCHDEAQRKDSVTVTCLQCGTAARFRPSTGELRKFCTRTCFLAWQARRTTGRIVNGRHALINRQGYVTLYMPDYPSANKKIGRVLEHRFVMEQYLGRPLRRDEQVHHKNGDKTDNRIENLEVLDPRAHTRVTVARTMEKHRTIEEERDAYHDELEALREKMADYERRFGSLE